MNLDNHAVIYTSRLVAAEVGYSAQDVEEMAHPIFDVMHPGDKQRFIDH